ncbi:Phosphate transport system permease protein PstA [Rubripirellula tenax]|uniref:Phosphate transport system permease protein PstA n=1 Tax=Rubripirellula tenax TaxID=2528015 RepID=A0A5C6FGW3_9BACT|nr:PstA family ABC transporter permease [Rubripirellula tenax]TWU59813.1 Phosphate transport system permease protein PstA [Rubripirellula tenax]
MSQSATPELQTSRLPTALVNQDPSVAASDARKRKQLSRLFFWLCVAIASISVIVLAVLLISIGVQGHSRLSADLIANSHSELEPETSGMRPAIIGSLFVCGVCGLVALPLGIGTAIFLEEFKPTSKLLRGLHGFIQLNIANLAGVPSIVFGLLGLTVFVYMFNVFGLIQVNKPGGWEWFGAKHYYQVLSLEPGQTILIPQSDLDKPTIKIEGPVEAVDADGNRFEVRTWDRKSGPKPADKATRMRTVKQGAVGGSYSQRSWYYFRLPFGKSFLAAGLTLSLVILPVIIIAAQEALRSVPPSLREASLGLGATQWQTTRDVSLPAALPGIMTGAILALGRAIGEAAPVLVVLGAAIAKNSGPQNLMDSVVTMPVLIFNWAGRPQAVYQEVAAAAIIVLLIVLLALNSVAIYVRNKVQSY